MTELVLTLNCFSFAGNYYKQINGVAMGTRMGPSYANLFVGYVEHQFFNQYNGPKPELYGRYIDDCIGAISSRREELDQFITSVNSFQLALKYTWFLLVATWYVPVCTPCEHSLFYLFLSFSFLSFISFLHTRKKEALHKSSPSFEVAIALILGLVIPVYSRQTGFSSASINFW